MEEDGVRRALQGIGMPEDLPEVVLAPGSEWSGDMALRIENQVKARGGKRPSRPRRWRMSVSAAVMVLLVALVGYGAVSAGWQQLLTFIPGVGIRPLDEEAWILPEPVLVEHDDWILEVTGVQATAENTVVNLRIRPPEGTGFEHRDKQTEASKLQRPSIVINDTTLSSNHVSMAYGRELVARVGFPPLPPGIHQLQLTLPESLGHRWDVELELVSATARDVFWHSHQLAGIPVEVAALITNEEAVVTVQTPLDSTRVITQLGFSSSNFCGCKQEVNGAGPEPMHIQSATRRDELTLPVGLLLGKERIAPSWCESHVQGDIRYLEYRFPLPTTEKHDVILEIPALVMAESVSTRFDVVLPARGEKELDQTISWGEHTLLLTRSERRDQTVRLYIEQPAGASYPLVGLDIKTLVPAGVTGSSYATCLETGEVLFIEIPVDSDANQMRLELSRPQWLVQELHHIELIF